MLTVIDEKYYILKQYGIAFVHLTTYHCFYDLFAAVPCLADSSPFSLSISLEGNL